MVTAVQYEIHLDQPTRTWEAAILMSGDLTEQKSLLVTAHGYGSGNAYVSQRESNWLRSRQLEADFCYLPVAREGTFVPLPPVEHIDDIERLKLVVRPFTSHASSPPTVASTLCLLRSGARAKGTLQIVSTHSPEVSSV